MKVKPILFGTPMVQAYLEDRKEMTRRIAKFPKDYSGGTVYPNGSFGLKYAISDGTIHRLHAKYQPGDILYVKETFYAYGHWTSIKDTDTGETEWRFFDLTKGMGREYLYFDNPPEKVYKRADNKLGYYKRPSLFMPYEAARIFLEVTNVRAERLQDITEEDAIREGIYREYNTPHSAPFYKHYTRGGFTILPIESFSSLWESINGPGSWDANPWVFVYEFKRAEKPE